MSSYLPLDINPNWKGGRTIASNGYVLVKAPDNPMADARGYVYEHRLVASEKLGRMLLPTEEVHHIDGNKQNNHPDNLEVTSCAAEHKMTKHRKRKDKRKFGEENPVISCACGCGDSFKKYDSSNRPRRFVTGHNKYERREQNG